jgi:ketosteroid isomerase-like protein
MRRLILLAIAFPFALPFQPSPLHTATSQAQRRQQNGRLHAMNIFSPKKTKTSIENFLDAFNDRNLDDALLYFAEDAEFLDSSFPSPFRGAKELERHFRLLSEASSIRYVVDQVVSDKAANKLGVLFHVEDGDGTPMENGKGTALLTVDKESQLITSGFLVRENNKSGESNLLTLKYASKIIELSKSASEDSVLSTAAETNAKPNKADNGFFGNFLQRKGLDKASIMTLPEQYFEAWNRRDMKAAVSVFADTVEYDDLAFPKPFVGKEKLEAHLLVCAECFPPSFSFVVDDKADAGDKLMVRWHVENNGDELPFTRGCSYYEIEDGKIVKGIDAIEPAVFKTGGVSLFVGTLKSKLSSEPIRYVPLAVWATYMYVVFFSDWFFGLPATALETRTWIEVRDLSLNFFFVSPLLDLPFAPVVHPMLEGTFNLLLSWAALFAGFLSDERKDKPNALPMLPMVAGMQLLTSAFLLPYLVTRSTESKELVFKEELPQPAQLVESPILGATMATVGVGSLFWAVFARADEFGNLSDRTLSFLDLLSIDRVGSSFIVDLVIFGLFQGWLVEDDIQRRAGDPNSTLVKAAKYVPFLGLAAYLTFRPPLPPFDEKEA